MPYPYAEARLLHVYGEMHVAKGEPGPAREWLETALAIFRRLGARKDAEQVEQALTALLSNLDALCDEADTEGAMWRELVDAWWDKYRDGEVGVADLFAVAHASERFDFGRATTERGQKTAFGMALSKQHDRIIGRYQVQRAGTQHRAALWRLVEVRTRVNLENHDEPFAAQSEMKEQNDTSTKRKRARKRFT
jgi:hypothetical protein